MAIPEQARWRLEQRLELRRRERWTALHNLTVRYRGNYAYVTSADPDGPLQHDLLDACREVSPPAPGYHHQPPPSPDPNTAGQPGA